MHRAAVLRNVACVFGWTRALRCPTRGTSLSDVRHPTDQQGSGGHSDFFDGHFQGGAPFFDASMLHQMQQTVRDSLTPEMRESMMSMMQSALQNDSGPGGQMGMMAFGVGENERGKRVARGASLSYDLKTGKVKKEFVESQIDPDDVSLPKETVEEYATEGAMEVEFVESAEEDAPSPPDATVR